MNKAYKYRIYPTEIQKKYLDRCMWASRKIQYFDGSCKLLNGKMLNNIVSYEDDWDNSNYNPLFGLNYYLNNKEAILNIYKN